MAERLYRVSKVAEMLDVSTATVYRLIEEKRLAAVQLDTRARQTRIAESELDRYQDSLTAA